jgi:hypothetical protein
MNRSSKLPRWDTRDQRERDALKRWTIERLDDERIARVAASVSDNTVPASQWLAEVAAWHGNMQPVIALARARLGIDLTPYLRPRKRRRGEYQRRERKSPWVVEQAVQDVKRIRALWQQHYSRWRRKRRRTCRGDLS